MPAGDQIRDGEQRQWAGRHDCPKTTAGIVLPCGLGIPMRASRYPTADDDPVFVQTRAKGHSEVDDEQPEHGERYEASGATVALTAEQARQAEQEYQEDGDEK